VDKAETAHFDLDLEVLEGPRLQQILLDSEILQLARVERRRHLQPTRAKGPHEPSGSGENLQTQKLAIARAPGHPSQPRGFGKHKVFYRGPRN
jgi:hypothetical protein